MNYINCILQDNFSNTQDLPGNIQDVDEVEGIIFCQKCHKYIESDWTAIPMSDGTMFFLCINCHKFSISNVDGEWKISADKIDGLKQEYTDSDEDFECFTKED